MPNNVNFIEWWQFSPAYIIAIVLRKLVTVCVWHLNASVCIHFANIIAFLHLSDKARILIHLQLDCFSSSIHSVPLAIISAFFADDNEQINSFNSFFIDFSGDEEKNKNFIHSTVFFSLHFKNKQKNNKNIQTNSKMYIGIRFHTLWITA